MFEKDQFVEYVGAASGSSYASGLSNIERLYGVDIDGEYEKDSCNELLSRLDELKRETGITQAELSNRQNRYSNLKKYIEFRNGGKVRIVDQYRQCFKDVPVGTKLSRQEIIDRIHSAFGTNDSSIIPSDYCYNMTNKGKPDGSPNFFLNVGTGLYEYVGESYVSIGVAEVIEAYKADFACIDEDERYKWQAIKWYKDHWNIDAQDFAAMFTSAFSKASNLLASNMYYPYKMICQFSEMHPEEVRKMFKALYDEEKPLASRYTAFRSRCDDLLTEYRNSSEEHAKANNHYQDLHAISVYLSFEYPEIYFIYKFKIYKGFRELIEFAEEKGKNKSEVWKLENYNRMCRSVLDVVKSDAELMKRSSDRLGDDCYQDEAHHLLTMDIVYFGGSRMAIKNKPTAEQEETENMEQDDRIQENGDVAITDVPKNTILYGPPGTGKTYHTVIYAVAIIENKALATVESERYEDVVKRYNDYKASGLVEFTTFHQSYGYEEFIEGIKPVMSSDSDGQQDIEYEISSGLFKSFCERAGQPTLKQEKQDIGINASPTIWKVSLEGTGNNATRTECLANGHIRIGYDGYGENITSETDFGADGGKKVLDAFIYKMQIGDIVLSCFSSTTIDAIGVVVGDYEWHAEYEHYKRLRKVNWLVKGIREDITEANGSAMTLSSVYRLKLSLSDVMSIVSKYAPDADEVQANGRNYVFIIDEINRGNISKIFGELITLIEPTKRIGQIEGTSVKLPYSKKLFGVPDNVYLIGTMNTADRSIATIDTALRRRFQFREMQPDPDVLEGVFVEDISIKELLQRMNLKISALYDREHTIGHAYFTALKNNPTIEALASVFENNIIPLLQEYFYEDYEKMRLVLGDNNKPERSEQFITKDSTEFSELFGNTDFDMDDTFRYEINPSAFDNIEAYRYI